MFGVVSTNEIWEDALESCEVDEDVEVTVEEPAAAAVEVEAETSVSELEKS